MAGEFTQAGMALIADTLSALDVIAHEIMQEADFLVPKDTETLRESARVFEPTADPSPGVTFGFGYGGAINPKTGNAVDTYAVPVHEILEVHHDPPTQAKFLEDPLFAHAAVLEHQLAAELRIIWGRETGVAAFGGGTLRRSRSGRFMRAAETVVRSG